MKLCSKCRETKPKSEFYPRKRGGLFSYCKACDSERNRKRMLEKYRGDAAYRQSVKAYRARNSLGYRRSYARSNLVHYGLTLETFGALPTSQSGLCAICNEQMKRPHVDHCHATGEVRGLLCSKCNTALGLLREDPALMRSAADYVLRAKGGMRLVG